MNAPVPEIPGFLDRRPLVWSYSLLHNFRDICPHQGEARYVTKTIRFVETPETKFGNEVHEAMALRVGGGKPLPQNMMQWERFAVPFDGKGAKTEEWYQVDDTGMTCLKFGPRKVGHGKLDLVIVKNDIGYLADWKTGNSKYEDPFELAVNAVLLKGKYPHLNKIIGQYVWLKDGRLSKPYDVSDTAATWREIGSIMQTVYNYRKLSEYPKRTSGLCGYCQRYDCSENPQGQG